jgi:tellurite resistance protein
MDSLQRALVDLMVVISACDAEMTDSELRTIGATATNMPIFRGFDAEALPKLAAESAAKINRDGDLSALIQGIVANVPAGLTETAYVCAAEVAAADGLDRREERRVLNLIAQALRLDPLVAAAIERAAHARQRRLPH